MRVLLIHGTFAPVFGVLGEDGRPVRLFAEDKPWTLHHGDLAGLQAQIEAFEARATAELEAGKVDAQSKERGVPSDNAEQRQDRQAEDQGGRGEERQEENA